MKTLIIFTKRWTNQLGWLFIWIYQRPYLVWLIENGYDLIQFATYLVDNL